jgi:hypothetical protein
MKIICEMIDQPVKLDSLITQREERIRELKEELKHVRKFKDEMGLLKNLSDEISTLRELREMQFMVGLNVK